MTPAVRTFFNRKADTWDHGHDAARLAVSERLIRGLGVKPGSKVLDVGCGTGVIIPWLLEAVGDEGSVTAMDIAERMLLIAREKCLEPNVAYIHASIERAPFLDRSFDEVVCHNCFPHISDKEAAAREMFRVLKPGGRVTICHNESREEINAMHRAMGGEVGKDMLPEGAAMESIFTRAGFERITIREGGDHFMFQAYKPCAEEDA